MIIQTIKQSLVELFPPVEAAPAPVAEETAEDEGAKKAPAKAEPRVNGVITCDYNATGYHLDAQVDPDQLLDAVSRIDAAGFFIESITGVDWLKENQLEVVYDFARYDFDLCRVVIRTRVDRAISEVPTITGIYSGANWHERETHDFFGIKFTGHPHLVPLLLPEDADFHPLLKDFKA
ncbi:MAG: NADH-quinone oxidoreductase subunit C [Desulfobulbaceae bacterium]|uniref:NADH-quinone oxidoreductase subunit C n=1 Tax=Candidatus Desulfatifera sulfidica TaxID=2841691 RepID=A0A8J6NAT1_9BACT|nr:NADH-quinone oxidoreductase subunit C [Candidatus Desulfatifera sulfidica]